MNLKLVVSRNLYMVRIRFINKTTNTIASIFLIIFISVFLYLGFNQFQIPTSFVFTKTEQTRAKIIEAKMIPSVKGYWLQLVEYEYIIGDSIYRDSFKAGQRQGLQVVGDELLLKYSISNPRRNKVIGFYQHSKESIKPIGVSSKDIEN